MAILRALKGLNPGQLFPLEGSSIVLGRSSDCDIVLEVGAVSRQHARIVRVDTEFFVEDLHSRNGTYLNEQRVVGRARLRENDQVRICDLVFVFHQGPPGEAATQGETTRSGDQSAMMVDDEWVAGGSTIMSRLEVSTGLRLTVRPEAKLKALVEIGQNLGKALSPAEVLPKLLDSLFTIFPQADRGFVVLKLPDSGRLVPMAVKYRRAEDRETIRVSRTIVKEVMAARKAILSADAAADSRFEMAESLVDFRIRSMMCAPLVGSDGDALGVIQVDTPDQRNRFQQDDLDVLASVAGQAAYAVENAQLHEAKLRQRALEHELLIAHEVQQGFLPEEQPKLDGYGFFDFYEAASQLGGDYYDYIPLPDGRLAVILADVSGKGVSAALLVARLSAEVRYSLASCPTLSEAASQINRVFCSHRWEDRFVTMVLSLLDPTSHAVTFVNAGHMSPLVRGDGAAREAIDQDRGGLPLGVDPDTVYLETTLALQPGESLVLYSDGITEAMNGRGELYGRERLLAQLNASDGGDVNGMGRRILDDVKQFVGDHPQSDDMCLACFGRLA